jgi:hypothetical protein
MEDDASVEIQKSERNTFASSQDMAFPNCVQGIDEAVSIINEHYRQWRQEKEK